MEYGTKHDRVIGLYFVWIPVARMLAAWALGLQVEVYFKPSDWSLEIDKSFGLLSFGPICFNWSE